MCLPRLLRSRSRRSRARSIGWCERALPHGTTCPVELRLRGNVHTTRRTRTAAVAPSSQRGHIADVCRRAPTRLESARSPHRSSSRLGAASVPLLQGKLATRYKQKQLSSPKSELNRIYPLCTATLPGRLLPSCTGRPASELIRSPHLLLINIYSWASAWRRPSRRRKSKLSQRRPSQRCLPCQRYQRYQPCQRSLPNLRDPRCLLSQRYPRCRRSPPNLRDPRCLPCRRCQCHPCRFRCRPSLPCRRCQRFRCHLRPPCHPCLRSRQCHCCRRRKRTTPKERAR
jgi:hypothetical protein